eukprot:gene7147-7718_t
MGVFHHFSMNRFFCLSLSIFFIIYPRQISSQREIDVSWDFNSDNDRFRSGWVNATSSTIDLQSRVEGGELRLTFMGWKPRIDSPSLFLNITSRHYLIMRARYGGIASEAQWLFRSGASVSPAEQLLIRTSYWTSRVQTKAIADTGKAAASHSRSLLVDGDPYTAYIASVIPFSVIVDLGSFRWITRIRIIPNDGQYHIYYLPMFNHLIGNLLRMRLEMLYSKSFDTNFIANHGNLFYEEMSIDYIRIVRAPEIWKVRGCLDKYYESANYQNPLYNITSQVEWINGHLPIYAYVKNNLSYQYATTYDCPLTGNVTISIEGINFGNEPTVYIGKKVCPLISVAYSSIEGRVQQILCTLPPGTPGTKRVRIVNGIHPGLLYEVPSLAYRVAPPVIKPPNITNIAAMKMDLVWEAPEDEFSRMTVTGYKILWFQPLYPDYKNNITVGNITTTSIRGLDPKTEYVFAIAAMAEGHENANLPTDLYGRRDPLSSAVIGTFSDYTNVTGTLDYDFNFAYFNSNKTLNHSGSAESMSDGPTGQYGGEGHYGLVMVGDANIQNCNVSSTCCDGYDPAIGTSSCGNYQSVCAVLAAHMLAYDYVNEGVTRRGVSSNLAYDTGAPPDITISTLDELIANKGADLPSIACGPALRLTPSLARTSGAAWYRRKMNVREGFDTFIKFEISNPSQKCDRLDDVNTFCRSRGADGFAFVIQNAYPDALGNQGSGLGYEGIFGALAVEFDTYHNFDQMDYYENHVSVLTQGFRYNITANHSRSIATSNKIPDLTDGIHQIRIKYDPRFDVNAALHPSFQTTGWTTWFFGNADFPYGGEGDWGTGIGLLYVYVDDMYSPVITTPINLGATLSLEDGRAYVGLTASTGDQYWQAQDILEWQFTSLFVDEDYSPPVKVNNDGVYECVNTTACVHPPDELHYTRKNNVWGRVYSVN